MTTKYLNGTFFGGLVLALSTTAVAAQEVTLTFHSPFGEAGINEGVRWWMDEVEERTEGRVEFRRIFGGTLGSLGGQPEGVNGRAFDVGQVSAVYNPGLYPRGSFTMLPFLSDDIGAHNAAVHDLMQTPEFTAEFDTLNQVYMFNGTWITMEMLSYEPLSTIADLEASRVRAHGGAAMAMEAAGITSFAIPFSELPAAAERRVVDAATMGAPTDAYDFGFGDIFDYWYQDMPFFFMPMTVVVNSESWAAIPVDLQAIILEINAEAPNQVMQLTEAREARNAEALINENGIQVIQFSDVAALEEAGRSTWQGWVEDRTAEGIDGQSILNSYQDLMSAQ